MDAPASNKANPPRAVPKDHPYSKDHPLHIKYNKYRNDTQMQGGMKDIINLLREFGVSTIDAHSCPADVVTDLRAALFNATKKDAETKEFRAAYKRYASSMLAHTECVRACITDAVHAMEHSDYDAAFCHILDASTSTEKLVRAATAAAAIAADDSDSDSDDSDDSDSDSDDSDDSD